MSQGNLVPFGKYKGQPIEAMAQDQQYCEWLANQPWFRERYQNIYTVIVNNFREPSETPEHNALQARFLDDDFRLKFASVAIPRLWQHAKNDSDVMHDFSVRAAKRLSECREELRKECDRYYRDSKSELYIVESVTKKCPLLTIGNPAFEKGGVDCSFYVMQQLAYEAAIRRKSGSGDNPRDERHGSEIWFAGLELGRRGDGRLPVKIEIKPEIGDDYPAILRQMRSNESNSLFTRAYIGAGVNQETFIQFMDSQGIRVIFEHEVDQSELLKIDDFDPQAFLAAVKREIEPQQFDLDSI